MEISFEQFKEQFNINFPLKCDDDTLKKAYEMSNGNYYVAADFVYTTLFFGVMARE